MAGVARACPAAPAHARWETSGWAAKRPSAGRFAKAAGARCRRDHRQRPMLRSMRTILRGDGGPFVIGRRRRSRLSSEAGFTLIEVLVASIVLAVGITALFALVDSSVKASFSTRAREGATSLARQVLEDAHTVPYSQLAPTSVTEQLQAMEG